MKFRLIICLFLCTIAFTLEAEDGKFVLLLGPSGVGKSTIIESLKKRDDRFVYISPYTTRPLRPGETNKIHVTEEKIDEMNHKGELLTVNQIYGIYYATPRLAIDNALDNGQFPILDWPADKMALMKEKYADHLFVVYLTPDNQDELFKRLQVDGRDGDSKRFKAGVEELERFNSGEYDKHIDLKIVNGSGNQEKVTQIIYDTLMQAVKSERNRAPKV